MTKTLKTYDADGVYTGEREVTDAEYAEHERKVAAYKAEVAARKPLRKNSSVYISHDNEE